MSKRRGMSLEEKRSALMDLYREKCTVFQLKELEKLASKEKKIVLQSVKDVNQSLIDDNLVNMDKIGISNYFWAFQSEAGATRQRIIDKLDGKIAADQAEAQQWEERLAGAKRVRPEGEERTAKLAKLAQLQELKRTQDAELVNFRELDPETLDAMKADVQVAFEAVNRQTDNIFCMLKWIGDKFPHFTKTELYKFFEVPEDLDYL